MPAKKKAKLEKITDIVIADPDLARLEVMAKLAAARASLSAAVECIDEAISHFVDTSDDKKGEHRAELIGAAEEAVGLATVALDYAGERMDDADTESGEDDEEDDRDDDDDEEDEEEDEDDEEEDDDD